MNITVLNSRDTNKLLATLTDPKKLFHSCDKTGKLVYFLYVMLNYHNKHRTAADQ